MLRVSWSVGMAPETGNRVKGKKTKKLNHAIG
jgi:hypothetical protein